MEQGLKDDVLWVEWNRMNKDENGKVGCSRVSWRTTCCSCCSRPPFLPAAVTLDASTVLSDSVAIDSSSLSISNRSCFVLCLSVIVPLSFQSSCSWYKNDTKTTSAIQESWSKESHRKFALLPLLFFDHLYHFKHARTYNIPVGFNQMFFLSWANERPRSFLWRKTKKIVETLIWLPKSRELDCLNWRDVDCNYLYWYNNIVRHSPHCTCSFGVFYFYV